MKKSLRILKVERRKLNIAKISTAIISLDDIQLSALPMPARSKLTLARWLLKQIKRHLEA